MTSSTLTDPTEDLNSSYSHCPKCQSTTPWGAASWCPDCGYYPAIAQHQSEEWVEPIAQPAEEPAQETLLPTWLKILFGGCFVLLAVNVAIRVYFYYHEGDLGLIALIELLMGMMCLAAAQCWASIYAMQKDSKLSVLDGLTSPIEIWLETIKDLPKGHMRVSLGVWGICTILFSIGVLGGFDIDRCFGKRLKRKEQPKTFVEVTQETIESNEERDAEEEELAEGLEQLSETSGATGANPFDRPVICAVYGYMTDGRSTPTRILLARKIEDKLTHAATIEFGDLPDTMQTMLEASLTSMEINQTEVVTSYQAKWVRPIIQLPIKASGENSKGALLEPQLVEVAKKKD